MWARNFETALGLWLAASPFLFGHAADRTLLVTDLTAASALIVLSLLSYKQSLSRAHSCELLVAAWLLALGWFSARQGPDPASQNHVLVGLLLAMLALVPSKASLPPPGRRGRASR